MGDCITLFTLEHSKPRDFLGALGIGDEAVDEVLIIPSAAFRVTYGSPLNRRILDEQTAERIKQAANICAVRSSAEAGRIARSSGRAICADAAIHWDAIARVHALSGEYARLAERMDATETKCIATERNGVWRRDLQESYEYLDREIERIGDQLKSISLSGA